MFGTILSFIVCFNGDITQCKPIEYVMPDNQFVCARQAQVYITEYEREHPKWVFQPEGKIRCTPMSKLPGRSA